MTFGFIVGPWLIMNSIYLKLQLALYTQLVEGRFVVFKDIAIVISVIVLGVLFCHPFFFTRKKFKSFSETAAFGQISLIACCYIGMLLLAPVAFDRLMSGYNEGKSKERIALLRKLTIGNRL